MNPYCRYRTPREVCAAVGSVAERRNLRFTPRPWNRHDPDVSAWWLVPSADWPAYRYGKLYFDWDSLADGQTILVGLYVEKGLGPLPEIIESYRSPKGRRHIMTGSEEWLWHRFVRDRKDGRVRGVVESTGQSLPFPVEIRIDGGYVPLAAVDALNDDERFDMPFAIYLLQWDQEEQQFSLTGSKRRIREMAALEKVRNWDELGTALEAYDHEHWLWIDVFVAIRFRVATESSSPSETTEIWDATTMWDRFLSQFLLWIG